MENIIVVASNYFELERENGFFKPAFLVEVKSYE